MDGLICLGNERVWIFLVSFVLGLEAFDLGDQWIIEWI
jgi:hypothetical protein